MQDIRISEDAILFSYYTKGSRTFPQDEEFFRMVDKKTLNNLLDTYVSTSMEINRRNLFMRVIKRYYNTMLDHYYAKCFVIDAITPPSRQF
jgi:hemerythrin superfamily protein